MCTLKTGMVRAWSPVELLCCRPPPLVHSSAASHTAVFVYVLSVEQQPDPRVSHGLFRMSSTCVLFSREQTTDFSSFGIF